MIGTVSKTFTILPPTIAGVKAVSAGYNSIKLSWTKAGDAAGYCIYRSTSKSSGYKLIKTLTNGYTSYTDKSLVTGRTYYYKIRGYKTVNGVKQYSAAYSAIVSKSPVPTAVTISGVSNTYSKALTIKWRAVTGASGYEIYRATSSKGTYKKAATITSGKTVSYKNTKLTKGRTYYYKVRAYRIVSGKKVYGAFGAVKSGKVLK